MRFLYRLENLCLFIFLFFQAYSHTYITFDVNDKITAKKKNEVAFPAYFKQIYSQDTKLLKYKPL